MDKKTSFKMWTIIVLLTSLNVQQFDLKGQLGTVRSKVGTVEKFLAKKFKSFKKGE